MHSWSATVDSRSEEAVRAAARRLAERLLAAGISGKIKIEVEANGIKYEYEVEGPATEEVAKKIVEYAVAAALRAIAAGATSVTITVGLE
uniref:De novo design protein XM2H n=1 Tax=synthetic construct TaxID=32630 RepID=UPI001E1E23C5|nr:Chain A, De novo design protein XM2H [synthetic construct]7DKK_B Chain B, De novo design protein XM2H [synthetic construct]7DKK_C Chain C, De novo design protein XM2H [synthetic construct]7DKK_D Chain D, De novo design protein XM2H [synthetic construct]